ncbi:MAG: type 4a pilus biogenesis protein PilO [Candidatus Omnitrophota bacterium]|nr:type 4a pilus biogenesis protein PilO [Candidatus Omnitrophota bacterium]
MELTKGRLNIVISAGLAIIALGLYLFLYSPLISKLRKARLECKRLETEVLQAREAIDYLRTRAQKGKLITEEDVSWAIDELTKKGRAERINFVSMTPKQTEEPRQGLSYKILPIEIEMESTYEDLGIFLGSLDELESCVVTVRNFNIAPTDEGVTKMKTKLVLNMHLSGKNAK